MTPSLPELCSTRRNPFAGASLRATLAAIGLCAPLFMGAAANAQASAVQSLSCDIGVIGSTNPCNLTPGTVLFTLGDKRVTFLELETNNPALQVPLSVDYSWLNGGSDSNFANDFWQLQVSAKPFFGNTDPIIDPYLLSYTYQVDIVDGMLPVGTSDPWFFNTVSLEAGVVPTGAVGTVEIRKLSSDSTPTLLSTLVNDDGQSIGQSTYTFANDYKSIIIKDTLSVPFNRTVSSITNSWTQRRGTPVPGPLPILGAGVAFGMSRRLRRRIKTTSVA